MIAVMNIIRRKDFRCLPVKPSMLEFYRRLIEKSCFWAVGSKIGY